MNSRRVIKIVFYVAILFSFAICVCEICVRPEVREQAEALKVKVSEHFDPSLSRLNSVPKFVSYCDSMYGSARIAATDSEKYAAVVSSALRDRFYHGYSHYSIGQNSLASLFAPLIKKDLNAIVIPNDILKHPMAACSQQSIIGMEVFKTKGFNVRKVGFFTEGYGGHFCFEAYFNGNWHFFDPDLEPSLSLMVANHFPGIADLVQGDSTLHKLYFRQNADLVDKLFLTYTYGPVNKFPAANARVFQYVTKYLSYSAWALLILVYWLVQKKLGVSKKKKTCAELQDSLVPRMSA